MTKYTHLLGLTAGLALMAPAAMADSIDPTSFTADLDVGESVTIRKTVIVNAGDPDDALIDVHFLFDTSASMGGGSTASRPPPPTSSAGLTRSATWPRAWASIPKPRGWHRTARFRVVSSTRI